MKRTIRQTVFPILTAFIWGTAFTAQSVGADYVGPLTFNALRSLIAFFALLVLDLAAARLIPGRRSLFQLTGAERRAVLIGGGACGVMLTIASYLQQLGLAETSAGKAGFITAMYIVIVPLFGLFLKRRPTALLWVSVAMAVGGAVSAVRDRELDHRPQRPVRSGLRRVLRRPYPGGRPLLPDYGRHPDVLRPVPGGDGPLRGGDVPL